MAREDIYFGSHNTSRHVRFIDDPGLQDSAKYLVLHRGPQREMRVVVFTSYKTGTGRKGVQRNVDTSRELFSQDQGD